MKKIICAWIGKCYSMARGLKSLLLACGRGFSSIFSDTLDFLAKIWYNYSRGRNMIKQELKQIAEKLIEENKLDSIKIQFKTVQKGRARFKTRKITIPQWALGRVKEYAMYYIIHEITHFIGRDKFGNGGHCKMFRGIEKIILRKYNIIPKYSKVYAKALYNLQGKKLCGELGKEI